MEERLNGSLHISRGGGQSEVPGNLRNTEKNNSFQEQSGVRKIPSPGHESSLEEVAKFEIYCTNEDGCSINKTGHFYLALTGNE
ncbi:MAG: hypothetical protein V3V99_10840 [candidate division Zixibacteria bacterium]